MIDSAGVGPRDLRTDVAMFAAHLDSRPWSVWHLADLLGSSSRNLTISERLFKRSKELSSDRGTVPDVDSSGQGWSVRKEHYQALVVKGDLAGAKRLVTDWLDHEPGHSDGFDYVGARTALATIEDVEGHSATAWRIIAPILPLNHGVALRAGAHIAEHRGCAVCRADAESLAARSVALYPTAVSYGTLLYVLWHQGRFDEAADTLVAIKPRFSRSVQSDEWSQAFLDAFATEDSTAEARAVDAMIRRGIEAWDISALATKAVGAQRYDMAFRLQSRLRRPGSGSKGHVTLQYVAYDYLAHWRGPDSAFAWLQTVAPQPLSAGPLVMRSMSALTI